MTLHDARQILCLDVSARITDRERRQRLVFPVDVPDGATGLVIRFDYQPGDVAGIRNLLTLSLFDPERFRGAAHRWALTQTIVVDVDSATPGFLPGPIPPGPWRVELDAHEIVSDGGEAGWCELHVTVEARRDPTANHPSHFVARPRPAGAMRPARVARWYRGDLHSHSVHSDGKNTIAEMSDAAAAIGLDFRAATDHNTTSQWQAPEPWPAGPLQIRGIECTTFFGHVNVLGTSDWIDWRTGPPAGGAQLLIDQVAAQKAFAVVNHPCDRGNPVCTGCRWEYPRSDLRHFDAIEVWNGGWLDSGNGNAEALALWTSELMAGHEHPAVAGSDSHSVAEYKRTDLPYTWVYAQALGEGEIIDALRRGRAYLSCGPTISFGARSSEGSRATLPGDRLPTGAFDLRVDVAGLGAPATLWLVADGEPRRLDEVPAPGGTFTAVSAAQSWWRLELRALDGDETLLALTNPVYHGQGHVAHEEA